MKCTVSRKISFLVISGVLTAIAGLALYVAFPAIMDSAINHKLVLREGSESYKFWKNVPVPIYIHFYFFNIKNTEEIWNLTHKPILEEMGPYTFRESREKINITWNANGTVTYRQVKQWFFQPDRTNGSLDDLITTLNVPMMAAAAKGKQMNMDYVYFALEEIFDELNTTWFVQKSVRELLFEGYEDRLITETRKFNKLPYDKFGWFYKRNDTDDGEINAFTGSDDISNLDEIFTWNSNKTVSAYSSPCNMINGSAGDMWPPKQQKSGKITLFVTDLCRSLSFTYLKEVSINKIKTYRYWADDTQLDNGKYDPNNRCFCSDNGCLPAGGINVSSCKFDAPAVVSYPHFLFADSNYTQGVIGMNPDPKKHSMYLDVIPEMGIPISVAARMQINIVFDPVPEIMQLSNISNRIYFPVLWFSETAEAGDDVLSQLRLVLNTIPLMSNIFSFIMVTVGFVLVMTAFVYSLLYALGKAGEDVLHITTPEATSNTQTYLDMVKDDPKTLSNTSLMEGKRKRSENQREPSYRPAPSN